MSMTDFDTDTPELDHSEPDTGGIDLLITTANQFNARRSWREAAEAYERVLDVDPDLAEIWVQLGHCRKEMGDTAGAEKAYATAAARSEDGDAEFHLAYLLRDKRRLPAAFVSFRDCYRKSGNPVAEAELRDLMGTTSPWPLVERGLEDVFDPAYYMAANRDLDPHQVVPEIHYLLSGWREGRRPSAGFDPDYYVRTFGRLMRAGEMPIAHFHAVGRPRGFRGSPTGPGAWFAPEDVADEAWDQVEPATFRADVRAVVVMPVYKGYKETIAAIFQALNGRAGSNYSLLVLNDGSTDAELNESLAVLARRQLFDYHFSPINRGFVKSINFALRKLTGDRDVVLLNADAYVFPGWFDRLAAHADADPAVATVTPLSNNATICSYPAFNVDNALEIEARPETVDRIAATVNAGRSVEAPTGVGFCFFVRRAALDAVGLLDDVSFPVGYGEENDFCMRALGAGYKNLIAGDVFVYHLGSVSFAKEKNANYDAGQRALTEKHTNYDHLVRSFIEADTTWTLRQRIDMARLLSSLQNGVLFVTHNWGGGIETYLRGRIDALPAGTPYAVLRVHDGHLASIDADPKVGLYTPNLLDIDLGSHAGALTALFDPTVLAHVHVNSFAGLQWRHQVEIMDLIRASGVDYTVFATTMRRSATSTIWSHRTTSTAAFRRPARSAASTRRGRRMRSTPVRATCATPPTVVSWRRRTPGTRRAAPPRICSRPSTRTHPSR